MSVSSILSAIKHNNLFSHRYIDTCQLCDKTGIETLNHRPTRVDLYSESRFGDLLYCSSCADKIPLYENLFIFSNLILTNYDSEPPEQTIKIKRSDETFSDGLLKNSVILFSPNSKKIYIKFHFLDSKRGYVFKSIELEKFFEHNKELFTSNDFRLILKMKKIDEKELPDMEEYKQHEAMWEEIVLSKDTDLFGEKFEIIYE